MSTDTDFENPYAFDAGFPLPFRALFLTGLGILGWATNLHGLDVLGIDAASALEINAHEEGTRTPLPINRRNAGFKLVPHPSTLYGPVYRLFLAYSLWCFVMWCAFRYFTWEDVELVDVFKYLPALAALGVLVAVISPTDVFQKKQRDMFIQALRRCLFPAPSHPIYFSDVVFADILTSFAKVFGDIWLSLCILWPGGSLLASPTQDGWSRWILPTLMSVPYAIRFRQCIIDYMLPTNESTRPFYNALKYASSFPVIFLSAAQRIVVADLVESRGEEVSTVPWHGEHQLFRLWLLAVFVNSAYSFWWDVTNDWGLSLLRFDPRPSQMSGRAPKPLLLPSLHFTSSSVANNTASPTSSTSKEEGTDVRAHLLDSFSKHTTPQPYGLRSHLILSLPVYPLVIFLDLILRFTWSIKLSSHLCTRSDSSVVIFWIEMAELVRRWMWVFIRVEWEVVKNSARGRQKGISDSSSPASEEFELLSPGKDGLDERE
ncbi:hypothetical protein JAAARDRAFT_129946 [Jaapia argillacea MUCL 33604]|uniref:EXS domain-containing protein n=1 Tax=Jaapia argillacea MUCL 33604 TaxID=933084 RepID=A0A067PST9_9AGAM|nr:hypothetical protein JAAARDRAFT_129946 [Jaapia argillacea MUCL 33604]